MQRYGNARHVLAWCSLWGDITLDFLFFLSTPEAGKVVKTVKNTFNISWTPLFFHFAAKISVAVLPRTLDISLTWTLIKAFPVQVWNETKVAVRIQFRLRLCTLRIKVFSVIIDVIRKYFNLLQVQICQSVTIEAMYFNVALRHVHLTISITYSKYVSVALVVHHAKRMRRIVMCGLSACKVFFQVRKSRSSENKYLNAKCAFWLYLQIPLASFLILGRKIELDIKLSVRKSSCKVTVIFSRVLMKFENSGQIFGKNTQLPNFMKIRSMGDDLFRADESRMDRQSWRS